MNTSRTMLAARMALVALAAIAVSTTAQAYEQYSLTRSAGNCADCHGDFRAVPYTSPRGGTWASNLHDTHRNTMLSGDCGACHTASSRFPVPIGGPSSSAAPFNTACLGCHGRVEGGAGLTGRGLRQHHTRAGETICLDCHNDAATSGFAVVAENVLPPLYITNAAHPNLPKDPCNPSPAFPENFGGSTLGLDNDGNGLYDAADPACVAAAPTINLNPSSLAFGSVNAGTTSAAQTSAIRNTGTAVLTVTSVARCAGTSTEFTFTAPPVPFDVAVGGSANLSVSYAPTAAGADSGCIAVTSNASNGPTTNLAVSGTGVAAARIAVSPTSLAFGNVTLGSPGTRTFTISNTGNATLTGSVALGAGSSTEFTFSPATFSIAAGAAAVTVTVTYAPTAVGADAGNLVVSSNDTTTPTVNVALSGTGVAAPAPRIAVAPTTLAFGNVTVGGTPGTQTFTISNTGTATLTGSVARAAGTSAEFTFSPATFSIAAGAAAVTVTVTYTPTAVGADTGSLTVSSNDATNATLGVSVGGSGVAAPAAVIALVPASLSFGTVTLGGSASLTTEIRNTGNALLTVSSIARGAGTSTEFGWSPAAPITVPAGGSSTVTVVYTPSAAGADTGTLVFTSDASNGPATLSVSGTGQPAAAPRIAVTPLSLAFGNVTAGTTSAARTFTVSNTGTATLTGTVARAGGTSGEFAFSPATFSIPVGGAAVTVSVTYAPAAVGADAGNLVVASNDAASPTVNVAVSGTGVAAPTPSIALVPSTLSFGNVTLGASGSQEAQVRNVGTATLTVTSVARCAGTSAEFSFTSPSVPFDVAPGASATIGVTYAPADLGTDSGCVDVGSNDPASPTVSLTVTGTGAAQQVPAIAVVPASLDFGTVTIGASASRTTTIQNTGTARLTVSGISLASGTSTEYGWSPAAPFDVAAGQSVTLTVTYRPVDASADAGSLLIASNDPANATVGVSLTGTGTPPVVGGVDIDVHELEVRERVYTWTTTAIRPEAELRNPGTRDGSAVMTLTGVLNDVEVYRQVATVTVRAGSEADFTFPAYTPSRRTRGTIVWTLTLQDDDPDVDQATATTRLTGYGSGDDRDGASTKAADGGAYGAGIESGGVVTDSTVTGGCTSGGSAGWLALAALALVLARRHRSTRRSGV